MENKWRPCWCCIVLGILIVVFAWWQVSWGVWALTALGAIAIICGIINKCCCKDKKTEDKSCGS